MIIHRARFVIPSRADGEGTHKRSRDYSRQRQAIRASGVMRAQANPRCNCEVSAPPMVAVPSTRLGMTALCDAIAIDDNLNLAFRALAGIQLA